MTGSGTRRVLFAVACIACLLAVTMALPAADPRLDVPGHGGDSTSAGDWDAIVSSTDPADEVTEVEDDRDDTDTSRGIRHGSQGIDLELEGAIEPGNEVTVTIDEGGFFSDPEDRTVEVNGESIGRTSGGDINVTVPYAEELTVAVPAENESKTVDVPTTATIETGDGAAPARDLEVAVAVGSTPVTDATVSLDGEPVATTDEEGTATVTLPETAGPVELHAERGPVAGDHTVDVAEPTVELTAPLLAFPGSPAPVQVSADGAPVSNATVSLEDGGTVRTDGDGRATVWLPIADEATATATVGSETATTTVGHLYLRLTAVVVLVPGFLIGATLTYFRYVAAADGRRAGATSLASLFLALADAFAGLADLLGRLGRRRPSASWPPWPSVSLPSLARPRFDVRFPSIDASMPLLGSPFAGLSSLGSLVRMSDRSVASPFRDRSDADGSDGPAATSADATGPELAAEPLRPAGPRAEVRAAWHAFVDRLGVEDRETRTPGQLARRAIAAGFPAATVRRLVAVFRDVEYGDREPSPDRVRAARTAANDLRDHQPDEEGSE